MSDAAGSAAGGESAEPFVRLAARHLVDLPDNRLYVRRDLPTRADRGAATMFGPLLEADEAVIGLYDDTVWGSGKNGILFTDRRLLYCNLMGSPTAVPYARIRTVTETSDALVIEDTAGVSHRMDFVETGGKARPVVVAFLGAVATHNGHGRSEDIEDDDIGVYVNAVVRALRDGHVDDRQRRRLRDALVGRHDDDD